MIPNAERWRVAVWEAQHAIMGYLPGYATPRIVCDVPYVGKRWVHQLAEYDRELAFPNGPRTTAPGSSSKIPRRWTAATPTTI